MKLHKIGGLSRRVVEKALDTNCMATATDGWMTGSWTDAFQLIIIKIIIIHTFI